MKQHLFGSTNLDTIPEFNSKKTTLYHKIQQKAADKAGLKPKTAQSGSRGP